MLALLVDVINVCSTTEDLALTLHQVLQRVCECNGWFIGTAHLGSGSRMQSLRLAAQHVAPGHDRLLALAAAGLRHAFSEDGQITRIIQQGTPEWIMLRLNDSAGHDQRVQVVTLPIVADAYTVGLFQFVSDDRAPIEPHMRQAIETIASLTGRTIRHKQLKAAAGRAASNERTRLGRTLHDTVCQQLAGLALSAERLQRNIQNHSGTLAQDAATLAQDIREAQQDLRAALADMLPIGLDHGHLAHALERLAQTTQYRYSLTCNLSCDEQIAIHDDHIATELYFIASEAASNAAKHSGADTISITLSQNQTGVQLEVRDNGSGIAQSNGRNNGYGLSAMRHRALSIHSKLTITSHAGSGTTVRCEVPHHALNEHSQATHENR